MNRTPGIHGLLVSREPIPTRPWQDLGPDRIVVRVITGVLFVTLLVVAAAACGGAR